MRRALAAIEFAGFVGAPANVPEMQDGYDVPFLADEDASAKAISCFIRHRPNRAHRWYLTSLSVRVAAS
jgi:hypothetical protein